MFSKNQTYLFSSVLPRRYRLMKSLCDVQRKISAHLQLTVGHLTAQQTNFFCKATSLPPVLLSGLVAPSIRFCCCHDLRRARESWVAAWDPLGIQPCLRLQRMNAVGSLAQPLTAPILSQSGSQSIRFMDEYFPV